MSKTRRSVSGADGLSSNVLSSSRKSGSSVTTPSSTTKQRGGSSGEEGSGLIVTRGLQEILDNDRKNRKPQPQPNTTADGKKKCKVRCRSSGQAPNFVICYLCGRQFGTASIDIHRPQCYLKTMIQWERGDPAIRGPKPMTPEEHEKMMKSRVANASAMSTTGGKPGATKLFGEAKRCRANEIERYNQMQMDVFNETALMPCPNCGRTFLSDRLQVHLRSCKPGNTARPVRRPSADVNNSSNPALTEMTTGTNGTATLPSQAAAAARKKLADPQKRAIRASGSHAVHTSAGPDDVPTHTTNDEDAAIRIPANYTFPEDSDASGTPPQAPSAKKPIGGPRGSNKGSFAAVQPGVNDRTKEEGEGVLDDTVTDIEVEEVKPPSPRADTEHRLSSVAILRDDPDMSGFSAPNRPASMEPSAVRTSGSSPSEEPADSISNGNVSAVYALAHNRGRERAAGSLPRKEGSTSALRVMPMPELISNPREEVWVEMHSGEDELESAPVVVGVHGSANRVAECSPEAEDKMQSSGSETKQRWSPKKIPLNNVSHFKNVESRLKQQRESEMSKLVPCQYCGRTFVPERIQRHEECCAERNKPPMRRSVQLRNRPSSAPASATAKHAKSASTTAVSNAHSALNASASKAHPPPLSAVDLVPSVPTNSASASDPASAEGKVKFCGGCGARVSSDIQKFCTECGFKL